MGPTAPGAGRRRRRRWNFGGGTLQERNEATPYNANSGNLNRIIGIY